MPDGMTARWDTAEWDNYVNFIERNASQLEKKVVKALAFEGRRRGVALITQEGGVRTGVMRARYRPTFMRGGRLAELTSRARHFPFYDLGTAPHEIRPSTKEALFWKGARHPVRRVPHPGTKPRRITDRTAEHLRKTGTRIADGVLMRFIMEAG